MGNEFSVNFQVFKTIGNRDTAEVSKIEIYG